MKAKKEYGRPEMRVVELRQHGMLMTSDPQGKSAQKQDYESVEWE